MPLEFQKYYLLLFPPQFLFVMQEIVPCSFMSKEAITKGITDAAIKKTGAAVLFPMFSNFYRMLVDSFGHG